MDTHITGKEGTEGRKGWNIRAGDPSRPFLGTKFGNVILTQRLKWTLESIGFFLTFGGRGDLDGQFGEGGRKLKGRATFSSPNIGIPFYEFQF